MSESEQCRPRLAPEGWGGGVETAVKPSPCADQPRVRADDDFAEAGA